MMKRMLVLLLLPLAILLYAQNKKPTTLREVLLAELRSTHSSEEWFVPANIAVKGLTAEQAQTAIRAQLTRALKNPQVAVQLAPDRSDFRENLLRIKNRSPRR